MTSTYWNQTATVAAWDDSLVRCPVGTAWHVMDVYTTLASIADLVATAFLGDDKLTSGGVDIAADCLQLVELVAWVNMSQGCQIPYDVNRLLFVTVIAQTLMVTFEQLAGFGIPDDGSEFLDGASNVDTVAFTLDQAASVGGVWDGSGARSYAGLSWTLKDGIMSMAEADHIVAHVVNLQAGEVKAGRDAFAGARLTVQGALPAAAFYCALCLATGDNAAFEALEKFVYTAIGLAAVAAAVAMIAMIVEAASWNAVKLQHATDKYVDIANKANALVYSGAAGVAATAPASVSMTGSGGSDAASGASSVPELFRLASGATGEAAPATAATDATEGPVSGAPAQPVTPFSPASPIAPAGAPGSLFGRSAPQPGPAAKPMTFADRMFAPAAQPDAKPPAQDQHAPFEPAPEAEAAAESAATGLGRAPAPAEAAPADERQVQPAH